MRILITDGMDKAAMAQLRELGHEVVEQFYEPDQLGAALRDFDAVVVRSKTKVRANHIDEAKGGKLKLIIRGGVGVDNIDVKYAEENGIAVRNTPGASSQSVAELAMGHMFACTRYISIAGHTMREGKWEKKAYGKGIELQGKTLGIIGFGRIGQHLGVMAKAIGMNVVAYSTTRRPEVEAKFGIPYVTLEELLAQSDFISLHAPAAFAPTTVLTRSMAAQVLWNLADSPAVPGTAGFTDVPSDAWYAGAVNWSAARGIVTGYSTGAFGPEDAVTREQLAAMLYRYAGTPEPTGSLDGFNGKDAVSDYAADALCWAVDEGLLTGKGGGWLNPAGTATRAEMAAILMRFTESHN